MTSLHVIFGLNPPAPIKNPATPMLISLINLTLIDYGFVVIDFFIVYESPYCQNLLMISSFADASI